MKHIMLLMYSFCSLLATTHVYSAQFTADLTVHVPTETTNTLKRLALESALVVSGVLLIKRGFETKIDDADITPRTHSDSSLEDGLHQRKAIASPSSETRSDQLLSTQEDDEDAPRKSCCSRIRCSRGVKKVGAGACFVGCGFSLEILRLFGY